MLAKVLKKSLSVFLAIVLVVSSVGMLSVLAVDNGSTKQIVKDSSNNTLYYPLSESGEGAATTTANVSTDGGKVDISKTIAGTDTENEFVVTLNVSTAQELKNVEMPKVARVVLVFDVSTSMDNSIYTWTDNKGKNHTGEYEPGNWSWDVETTRWTSLKEAAASFINNLMPTGNTDNQVAIVVYGGSNVSNLNTNHAVLCNWTSSAVSAISTFSSYQCVSQSTINNTTLTGNSLRKVVFGDNGTNYGATNCQAGFVGAYELLDGLADASTTSNYVVYMSDGDTNRSYENGFDPVGGIDYNPESDSGATRAQSAAKKIVDDFDGTTIFTVGFNTDKDNKVLSSEKNTAVTRFFSSDDTAGLKIAYNTIINQIKIITQAWTVSDPMGDYITLLTDFSGDESTGHDYISSAADGTITWDLRADLSYDTRGTSSNPIYSYTMQYRIRLETGKAGFNENVNYLTNGVTTLEYTFYDENGNILDESGNRVFDDDGNLTEGHTEEDGKLQSINFNVPKVNGEIPELAYSIEFYLKDENGEYTLKSSDTINETIKKWQPVSAPAGYAAKYESVSGENLYGKYTYTTANPGTMMQITGENQVMKLYYDPIPTNVTVNHFYTTKDWDGTVIQDNEKIPASGLTYSEGLYEGDLYTAATVTDGYNIVSETSVYTDVALGARGETVINIYYEKNVDTRNDVNYTINHHYTLTEYVLDTVSGTYKPSVSNWDGTPINGNGKEGVEITATLAATDGYAWNKSESTTNTLSGENGNKFTLVYDYNNDGLADTNVIDMYYVKTIDNRVPATVEIYHNYTTRTVSADGTSYSDSTNKTGGAVSGTYYVGETYSAYAAPEGFTQTGPTADGDVLATQVITLQTGKNVINFDYFTDARVETALTVNHIYRDYPAIVDKDTGNVTYGEPTVSEPTAVTPSPVAPATKWYVGNVFTAELDTKGGKYTLNTTDELTSEYEDVTLTAGNNVINLYYDAYEAVETADVTIYHHYTTYTTYYKDGVLVENDPSSFTDTGDTTYGEIGESFIAGTVTTASDGNTYTYKTPADLTVTYASAGGEFHIYYERSINDITATDVTVKHHYITYTTSIDASGNTATTPTETDTKIVNVTTGVNEGQSYTAAIDNADSFSNTYTLISAGDESRTPYITDEYANVILGETGANVIDIYYYRENDARVEADVVVRHYYTYTHWEIVEGVRKQITDNDNATDAAVKKYVGESYTAAAKLRDYTMNTAEAALTIKVDEGMNYIDIYYVKNEDNTNPVTVTVTHHYSAYDWDNSPIAAGTFDVPEDAVSSYAGVPFTATTNTRSDTYALNPADQILTIAALSATETNHIDIYYVRNEDTRVDTTATVYHSYRTYDDYLNAYVDDSTTKEPNIVTGKANGIWVGQTFDAAPYADIQSAYVVESYTPSQTIELGVITSEEPLVVTNAITINYVKHIDTTPEPGPTPENPPEYDDDNYWNITVNYIDAATGEAISGPASRLNVFEGSTYDMTNETNATFEGYTATGDIEGTVAGSIYSNVVINVYYTRDAEPIPEEPPVEIPDEDTPLDGEPTDIPDEDVPMEETPDEVVDLEEEDVPLADVPKTGDNFSFIGYAIAAAASATALVAIMLKGRKSKKEDEENR